MNRNRMTKGRVAFILFCVAIPVLNWLIFYVFANISSFVMAFTNKDGIFSLDNFVRFFNEFKDPVSGTELALAFKNTFITFGVILISYPFKVLVSYFIYKKVPFAGFYRIVFFIPMVIFNVALALIVQRILGIDGIIAQTVGKIEGLDYVPELLADERYANATVILHMLWLGFPGDLIIWGGTFARIPVELLESGRVDGVTWWSEFTRIIVPLVWPTVALQMVLMFCQIFSSSGAVFLLTGGAHGTQTFNSWMYNQMYHITGKAHTSNAFNYMSAVGMCITILAVTISLVVRKFTDKAFNDVDF